MPFFSYPFPTFFLVILLNNLFNSCNITHLLYLIPANQLIHHRLQLDHLGPSSTRTRRMAFKIMHPTITLAPHHYQMFRPAYNLSYAAIYQKQYSYRTVAIAASTSVFQYSAISSKNHLFIDIKRPICIVQLS